MLFCKTCRRDPVTWLFRDKNGTVPKRDVILPWLTVLRRRTAATAAVVKDDDYIVIDITMGVSGCGIRKNGEVGRRKILKVKIKTFVVIFIVLHKEVFSRMTEKIKEIWIVMYNYEDSKFANCIIGTCLKWKAYEKKSLYDWSRVLRIRDRDYA